MGVIVDCLPFFQPQDQLSSTFLSFLIRKVRGITVPAPPGCCKGEIRLDSAQCAVLDGDLKLSPIAIYSSYRNICTKTAFPRSQEIVNGEMHFATSHKP